MLLLAKDLKATLNSVAATLGIVCFSLATGLKADPLDHWTMRDSRMTDVLKAVGFGGGLFVLTGGNYAPKRSVLMTSRDGGDWTMRDIPNPMGGLNGVTYGNGRYVVAGSAPSQIFRYDSNVLVSVDGLNWNRFTADADFALRAVAFGNGRFVVLSSSGPNNEFWVSTDAMTWGWRNWVRQYVDVPGGSIFECLAFGNDTFVAAGTGVYTSTNGSNWVVRYEPEPQVSSIHGMTYGAGLFVGVDDALDLFPSVVTSSDGVNWIKQPFVVNAPGVAQPHRAIAYGNGTFVTVGTGGGIYTSANGTNWTQRVSPTANALTAITYGNGRFVAAGLNGTILQSGYFGPPLLSGRLRPEDGAIELSIDGELDRSYLLQTSMNLTDWNDLLCYTNVSETMQFVDTDSVNHSKRFYRVVAK